jgi:Tfp pilus assembly protein PilW
VNARREQGLSMVEVMVATGLLGLVAALAFGMQSRVTQTFRDQSNIAEAQQILRAAHDLLVRELRQAGYLSRTVRTAVAGSPTTDLPPVSVQNDAGADGSDILRVLYADPTVLSRVRTGTPFAAGSTAVDDVAGWAVGDVALASRTGDPEIGRACVLQITSIDTAGLSLGHDPTAAPWNTTGNPQCAAITTVWDDGYTVTSKLVARAYRIKPGDPRGVLQRSPSGGLVANDWEDAAVGVVDLQVALRVYQPGDATDVDGDGDAQRDWYSGDLMDDVTSLVAGSELMAASITLVVRTTKEVRAPQPATSPDVFDAAAADLRFNRVGDHPGTPLPVTSPTSVHYGNHLYRTLTTTVDLRNVGIGR